jgi:hypothetical protein
MAAPNWKTLYVTPLAAQLASSKRKLSYKNFKLKNKTQVIIWKKMGGARWTTHTPLSLSLFISHIYFVVLFLIVISRTTAKEIKKKKKYPLLPFRFFLFFSFVTLACCAAARVFDIIITFGLFFRLFLWVTSSLSLNNFFFCVRPLSMWKKMKKIILGCVDE